MRRAYSIKSVVIALVIINVVIFLLTEVMNIPMPRRLIASLSEKGSLTLAGAFDRYGIVITIFSLFPILIRQYGWVWQVFTYMFLHGSFIHVFFNMYALLLFGRPLEQRWGKSRFLMFYFFTGVGAGIVTLIWHLFGNPYIPTIGASGAIFGIVLAFGLEFPDALLLLFFLIPVRARYAAFIFGGIELLMIATGSMRGIGHFTHLAGLLFGYIYYVWRIKGRYTAQVSGRGIKARIKAVRTRRREILPERSRERALLQAEQVKLKIERNEELSQDDENFLEKLRQSYNIHGREMCSPDEFNPRASDCVKCDSLLACLYRYVLDIQ